MGSQDNTNRKTYNDPSSEVEQYSLEYMRSLKGSAPEEMLRLWEAGHFTDAIAEQAADKAANRAYTRNKGVQAAGSIKGLEAKQEAEQAEAQVIREDRKKEALAQLRRLGVNPEDLR
ncbi:hypothetical protein OG226_07910 [Streptomyces sp. NBC_01261]|uniref:hypothetical protein n=1 Tax=Streptomyces sp. NBC_01261 TaxID=2903802 RepID=UPI002E351BEF|nr:hypothetical protein [Streptomyces sp. NBC_01261]